MSVNFYADADVKLTWHLDRKELPFTKKRIAIHQIEK